jgi:glucosyl-3-phosphoglycerate synthase
MLRTFRAGEFDPARLVPDKAGRVISVCLPARDEQDTVGPIVDAIRRTLMDRWPLVDELLVVDDHSSDRTAAVAADAGATILRADEILPGYGHGHGKGEALWKSLYASKGDLIVWCDADVRHFDPSFVVGLVGPLLTRPDVAFVKGFYDRPVTAGSDSAPGGVGGADQDRGGRVTELVARPVVSLLFPQLAPFVQPLAGEYAGRREVLEQLPFIEGYGVDLGLLIDIEARFGLGAMAQVDLGQRIHRNRPLDQLSPQAMAVLQAALHRAAPTLVSTTEYLVRPGREPLLVDVTERPPLVSVPEYRRSSA